MTSLAFLSLSRVGHHRKVPHVPSNTERLQAFRRYQPVQFANTQLPRSRPANSPTPSPGWAAPSNFDGEK